MLFPNTEDGQIVWLSHYALKRPIDGPLCGIGVEEITGILLDITYWVKMRIDFKKYGHDGIWIESRINGGNWPILAIDTVKPYLDERPLAPGNTHETREYRLRWWDTKVSRMVSGARCSGFCWGLEQCPP